MEESPEGVSGNHTNQPKKQQNDNYCSGHIFPGQSSLNIDQPLPPGAATQANKPNLKLFFGQKDEKTPYSVSDRFTLRQKIAERENDIRALSHYTLLSTPVGKRNPSALCPKRLSSTASIGTGPFNG